MAQQHVTCNNMVDFGETAIVSVYQMMESEDKQIHASEDKQMNASEDKQSSEPDMHKMRVEGVRFLVCGRRVERDVAYAHVAAGREVLFSPELVGGGCAMSVPVNNTVAPTNSHTAGTEGAGQVIPKLQTHS